jgi:uncharacterized membrane protein YqaE (UPF0057 family)
MQLVTIIIDVKFEISLNFITFVQTIVLTNLILLGNMSLLRVILAIIFPPLAVVDKGCGSFLIVFILTCLGWIPGVIAALIILNKEQ